MPECFVSFHTIDDVLNFVSIATRYLHPVQVSREEHTVAATSLMGLFCMGLHTPLRVTVMDQDADPMPLFRELQPYVVH